MKIRNVSSRDLEVAGRVYRAGETVAVNANEAKWLGSNPNFKRVGSAGATSDETADPGSPAAAGSTDAAPAARNEEK